MQLMRALRLGLRDGRTPSPRGQNGVVSREGEPTGSGDVDIYLSSLNGVDTALEYVSRIRAWGGRPNLCFEPHLRDEVEAAADDVPLIALATPARWHRALIHVHAVARDHASSLIPGDNPANASLFAPTSGWKRQVVLGMRRSRRRPPSSTVNRALGLVFRPLAPHRFPNSHVIAISTVAMPMYLCRRGLIVDTVVDSWDHAVRKVSGYPTNTAIAWNMDLARDWQKYQGARRLACGPAVKFRYAGAALALKGSVRPERTLMYAMATSSHHPAWFDDELALLKTVCRATSSAGWRLIIKPKPMNHQADFVDVVKNWQHVTLGAFHETPSPLDFRLDERYNASRLAELASSSVVLNTVTTFGLDAACAGVPVLQLDLSDVHDIRHLAGAARNQHLREHLYRVAAPHVMSPRTLLGLEQTLLQFLDEGRLEGAQATATSLRGWLNSAR